ncbi:MAG: DUF4382 domain-containing protein [Candidatus Aenigmarchaeota archaeon]|nr:DUF4382 domain-containing protein [Candidatus Aenigmarchaeota archaeon]NIP40267.1 DUF4382 domain-containing protein [Candidatus Aenigmarchaeota archaeon]
MRKEVPFALMLVFGILVTSGCVQQPTGTGTLVLQITDKPALNIEKAEVTISKIQVHVAEAGNESGWTTVVEEGQTFDLVAIKDVKEFLGSKELSAGIYTQIRLDVDSAKVTIDGEENDLTIPSKTVKLVKSFEIKEGETTTLTLDFDAEQSVHETGSGKYMMKPTIKVLSSRPEIADYERLCEDQGGNVTTSMCCLQTDDFPNLCVIGPCGCSPDNSHDVKICDCGEGNCFDGERCIPIVTRFSECVRAGYTILESFPRKCETPDGTTFLEDEDHCTAPTEDSMSLFHAVQIAVNSTCIENASLTDWAMCSEDTGTWWIGVNIMKTGCSPVCAVDIVEGTAEIDWRCTEA